MQNDDKGLLSISVAGQVILVKLLIFLNHMVYCLIKICIVIHFKTILCTLDVRWFRISVYNTVNHRSYNCQFIVSSFDNIVDKIWYKKISIDVVKCLISQN